MSTCVPTSWEKIGVYPFTRRVSWEVKADEEKREAKLAAVGGVTAMNMAEAHKVAFGAADDEDEDEDEDEDDDEEAEEHEMDAEEMVRALIAKGARLGSAILWDMPGGLTTDNVTAAVREHTMVGVIKRSEADAKRKAKTAELTEKVKKARAESAPLVEAFKADESETKKKLSAAQLKIILLAHGIAIPAGTVKAGLVKLIIDSGLV
jgi:hypothetical protein